MRLNENNPATWMGGKLKAFESAMRLGGGAFQRFHDGRFRLGGPWKDGAADGDGDGNDDREESWKAMLEALFGEVPEGEGTPPPCDFLMVPTEPAHRYFGVPAQLPSAAGRMEDFPFPVRNQFDRGACFAFAMTALCEHGFAKRGRKTALSEQSLYCFTKQETRVEVDEQEDGVERLRDAVRAVEKWGIAPLEMWPYDPNADGWNFVNYAGDCAELVQAASAFRWGYWKAFQGNSVAELKEWLAKGHPVCIGVRTTPAWQADSAKSSGTIPYFPQHWSLVLDKTSALRAAEAMSAATADDGADEDGEEADGEETDGEETEGEGQELLASLLARLQGKAGPDPKELLEETRNRLMGLLSTYTGERVAYGDWEESATEARVPIVLKATGGHAVCLVGYQDDEEWAGGGYFVMRNSWGAKWGKEGHGRIPYEYLVQMGDDAYVMLYEAGAELLPEAGAEGGNASGAGGLPAAADVGWRTGEGFGTWLAERRGELSGPDEVEGVWSRPGTRVLYPEGMGMGQPWADTPANVARMKILWEQERARNEVQAQSEGLFGRESAAAAAFAAAGRAALAFHQAVRERLGALGAVEEFADLSEAWVKGILGELKLPEGVGPDAAWMRGALAANRAMLCRVAPSGKWGADRWALVASLCPFEHAGGNGLKVRQATADDLNALQEVSEAALQSAGRTATRPFYYLLNSLLGWSGATIARLAGSGQPLVLAWPDAAGWKAALPSEGRLDAATSPVLDALLPVAPAAMLEAVRGALEAAFREGEYAVPLAEVRRRAAERLPLLGGLPERFVRAQVLVLQKEAPERYHFVRGFGGQEEVRAHCKDLPRITV